MIPHDDGAADQARTDPFHRRLHGAQRRWHAVVDRLPGPVVTFGRWLGSPEFSTVSAALAFYALVSLPPMVLIAFWVAGLVVDDATLQGLGNQVSGRTPDQLPIGDVLRGLIDVASRIGPVAVLSAVWPATAYGAALARAFTEVTPQTNEKIRGLRGRLLALAVIAVLPVAVFSGLAALFVVPRLLGSGWQLTALLGLGVLVLLVGVISLVYWLFQVRDTRWDDVVLGALLAAGLVGLSTAVYLGYLTWFADFTERYGASSLATLVLLGFWLLIGNAVLLVGYRFMIRRALRRADEDA
ncbi:YihY/virulence factor BrkB family protein [Klenkia sp. PcliD-1-E]|uniref:YihY/virulence factor BrkB family protein n=1 Tax=Klenkia sp. PcliD-1-E TaxID=2954492 RepID=UPI002096A017|nr:YihY/virulence factor BrkB family protein [Klenkia sp. PcliD-1-E]MCO7219944.1 YihY/virulence factor BrkB family protein [Klenkia sp. PcliD-1-E]